VLCASHVAGVIKGISGLEVQRFEQVAGTGEMVDHIMLCVSWEDCEDSWEPLGELFVGPMLQDYLESDEGAAAYAEAVKEVNQTKDWLELCRVRGSREQDEEEKKTDEDYVAKVPELEESQRGASLTVAASSQ
jgi:hypothetical protein